VSLPNIVIISPALREANNGNWQTAARWQKMLRPKANVRISKEWTGNSAEDVQDTAILALHARRSAAAIGAWHAQKGSQGLVVALTGTDLYRDIQTDKTAQQSLEYAKKLIVLQELGAAALPAHLRHKASVIFQSTSSRKPLNKTRSRLRALMVGHLRDEKSPSTFFEAAAMLRNRNDIYLDHIGDGLDPLLADAARNTQAQNPNYRWLGGMPHAQTRAHVQRAHVLVHASVMEGGAHVIMEAVCSGTPVLASRIAGNVGMLGENYDGYFEFGQPHQLTSLLLRCREAPLFLAHLTAQCADRATLFHPQTEQASLQNLIADLLKQ
jgi:putative glycosyltransferase (TIGR04348 family)